MPKTIAITPSWYWPAGVQRVVGVPPFTLPELLVERRARRDPEGLAAVDSSGRLSNAELAARVAEAAAAGPPSPEALSSEVPTVDGLVALLGALGAGVPLRFDSSGRAAAGTPAGGLPAAGNGAGRLHDPLVALAAGPEGDLAWHTQRSLLAGGLSLAAFLELGAERPWLSTFPLGTWEGLYGVVTPLAAGAPVVLSAPGEASLEAIVREGAGGAFTDLDAAYRTSREAKRDVKAVRGVMSHMLLSTGGMFDPDQRRRVGKMFETAALSIFGLPETGPIFAAHPSWYIDEAIGIPMTNAHVVPVDPRSLVPVQTLWELVESARVTVFSPMLTAGYEGGAHAERFHDGRFVTSLMASSDANGMIYLLPD